MRDRLEAAVPELGGDDEDVFQHADDAARRAGAPRLWPGEGTVEGGVRHIIGERFDCGGMRWIKERAQALLQQRCIAINNDWDAFISFVDDKLKAKSQEERQCQTLLNSRAPPIPLFDVAPS